MSAPSGDDKPGGQGKRPFVFKASVLSKKADEMWSQTKKNFDPAATSTHLVLEKKSLSDVLAKMAAEKKEKEEKSKERPSFVFGSNISSRVIMDNDMAEKTSKADVAPVKAEDLFKNVAAKHEEKAESNPDKFRAEAEAAAAAEKQKLEERQQASTSVTVTVTGEEEDEVVHQTACKLHIFDKEKNKWVEKGLSHIKLNKRTLDGETHHRIVARTAGNHRVVINSKIFNDMILERVDEKRIKISAMGPDAPGMQIFLITIGFSKTDINVEQFYDALKTAYSFEKNGGRKRKAKDSDDESSNSKKPVEIAENETEAEADVEAEADAEVEADEVDEADEIPDEVSASGSEN